MKLTILGSGTVVPNGQRNSSGYFVESRDVKIMLDCGAGTVHALDRYGLPWRKMTHLFISHFHVDHAGELASLFFAFKHALREERREPFTVVGPRAIDRLTGGLKQAFGDDLFSPKFPVDFKKVAPGDSISIGADSRLRVAKTPHTEESLAVRIEAGNQSVCYTGDTDYSDDLAEFFSGADLLVSECSFKERREGVPHLSITDVARVAERARVKRLVVTHFYFDVDEAEVTSRLQEHYRGEVILGRDGLAVDLGNE